MFVLFKQLSNGPHRERGRGKREGECSDWSACIAPVVQNAKEVVRAVKLYQLESTSGSPDSGPLTCLLTCPCHQKENVSRVSNSVSQDFDRCGTY